MKKKRKRDPEYEKFRAESEERVRRLREKIAQEQAARKRAEAEGR